MSLATPHYDELMRPLKQFRATGKTYQHREKITAWGWHWNPNAKCWETEADDEFDVCVRAVAEMDGVLVEEVSGE